MSRNTTTKIEKIKAEIGQLSEKIARRIEELEERTGVESVMEYRHDPTISKAIIKMRYLYDKGEKICARNHLGEKACKIFRDEPPIIRRLELSDENLLHL